MAGINLDAVGASAEIRDIEFRIEKDVAADIDYIGFSLNGNLLQEIEEERMAAVMGRVRTDLVAWPITARSNILEIVSYLDGDEGYVVRKTPDPGDCCAPEKVR
jgi:hypothetical protein